MSYMNKLFSLEEKIAIVTGAGGLLGKQHCIALAEAGAHVIAADIDRVDIEQFPENLHDRLSVIKLDVTDTASLSSVRERIVSQFGTIDIIVNNAAINDMVEKRDNHIQGTFEDYPLYLWKKVLDVNVTGVFLCCQYFGSIMEKKASGTIINIASTYGVVAPDQSIYLKKNGERLMWKSPVYPTSKGAVIQFTKYLAAYWASKNIRVNCLSPGGVFADQDQEFVDNYRAKTPMGRMANSDDYKGTLVFLASDASAYLTGANIIVDGGWTII